MTRAPSRFGVLALLGLSVLAACGWQRLAGVGRRRLLALTLIAAIFRISEVHPGGLGARMRRISGPPDVARWLSKAPRGPVLELPWEDSAEYMYWSTTHWQPMINGAGTFAPGTGNVGLGLIGIRFTRPYASRVLRGAGVVWVVVHLDRLHEGARERILTTETLPAGVRLVASFGQDRVYEIGPGPMARRRAPEEFDGAARPATTGEPGRRQ